VTSYDTLDAAFVQELLGILVAGESVAPRSLGCSEVEGRCFRLSNPRARLITNAARRWSLPYAVGEFCWHLSASDEVGQIAYYAKRWEAFADEGHVIRGSCYGRKLFDGGPPLQTQWARVRQLLLADPSSRRAVLSVFTPDDLTDAIGSPDLPCCCSLHFLIRDGRLNLITYMRSNDIFTGFGYDIFFFTMLQELMSCELGVGLGWYQHVVGSLHLYDHDRPRVDSILESPTSPVAMPPMAGVGELHRVLQLEREIREGSTVDLSNGLGLSDYWLPFVGALQFCRDRKNADTRAMQAALMNPRLGWSRRLLELLA
jgi:thymidylate synthase